MFPALIPAINIGEVVIRDFQVAGMQGMHDGIFMVGRSCRSLGTRERLATV